MTLNEKTKSVIYFGSYDPNYSRNRIIRKGLEANGVKVFTNQAKGIIFIRYFKLVLSFLKVQTKITAIIVGFPGHYDMPLAFILGKIFKKRVFYDIFASTYETYVLDRKVVKEKSLRAKFFYLLDWVGLKLADYVVVDTKAHGRFYQKLYGVDFKKTILVYVGSDTDYFYPRKTKETTDVLFYGSYQPLQGTDVIIKAAAILPNVKFKMIGEGQEKALAESLAKNLKLKNVDFVDWLSLKNLAVEIRRAKICLGIFGNSQKAKTVIPNKVYDYLATGKPVITVDSVASREILKNQETGTLVKPGEDVELAKQINRLIQDFKHAKIAAAKGYKLFTEKFRPILVTRNLTSKIYEE